VSNADLDLRATQLRRQGVPFVRARVVLAEKPTSAKAGDEAIIHADGSIEGFVGGTCAETTVRAQSLLLLDTSEPLLLRITPTEEPVPGDVRVAPGTRTVHNPCLSGGTLEIFLDPVVPPPLLAVHGEGPIAAALTRLAGELGYRAAPVGAVPLIGALAVVVASHGREEVETLAAALDAGVPYIGLVASRRRAAGVLADLAEARPDLAGVAAGRVHSPAGLDIGARTASEIALSILAEVVTERVRVRSSPPSRTEVPPAEAVDPICGMTVAAVDTSLHLDHDGQRWYFCGPGCQRAFSAEHLPDPVAGYAAS
jgi:xanthine dehydrogenase accessory factor